MTAFRRRFADLATAYVRLWDRREPVGPIALVRILVAAVLLFDLLQAWSLDLLPALWAPYTEGGLAKLSDARPEEGLFWTPTTDAAWILWGAATGFAGALLIGLATPVSCAGLLYTTAQLAHLSPKSDVGIDILLRWALLILVFSRCGATWSVDALVLHRRFHRPQAVVPAWPRYLLVLQLVVLYFVAGLSKAPDRWTPWGGAYAVYLVMWDPTFSRFGPDWMSWGYPLTRVMTVVTYFWELASPLVLVAMVVRGRAARGSRAWRWATGFWLGYVILGVGFHLALAVTMRLGIFAHGVLALYPAWFHPSMERARATR